MKILVSNDDGYRAEGIVRLRAALSDLAEVTVVAPDRNRSGASSSLTLEVPVRATQSEPGVYFLSGTPTDCVHLAVSGLFDFNFDMVASGVNDGPNLGDGQQRDGDLGRHRHEYADRIAWAKPKCAQRVGRAIHLDI